LSRSWGLLDQIWRQLHFGEPGEGQHVGRCVGEVRSGVTEPLGELFCERSLEVAFGDHVNSRWVVRVWLDERVHAVPSRSTGVAPAERAEVELELLAPLPRVRFDTDHVETRRVHDIVPFISVDGVRHSVRPKALGQLVEIRRPVDSTSFEVRWAGTVVARHTLAQGEVAEVWADDHRRASVAEALGRHERRRQRHLRAVTDERVEETSESGRLDLGPGDFDVDAPDLATRYSIENQEAGA
jgi:hypothetical protein